MSGLILSGIDASNPLAYLAALGGFRVLSGVRAEARLQWVLRESWQPELLGVPDLDAAGLCELLRNRRPPVELLAELGKNITVPASAFRDFVRKAAAGGCKDNHAAADFAAAFGSEACVEEKKDRIQYTLFCFITGSGHQDFLETMASLAQKTSSEQLREALFETWKHADKGLSFRWDPAEAREYALRWDNPGPEGVWTSWGANRLAVEALPLFPAHPRHGLRTTGFETRSKVDEFTWPVWTAPVSCDTVRSLVGLYELQEERPDRQLLREIGIGEVYRAQRIRIGAGANFKVSFRPARAV
jgi:hypothetical protein